MENWVVGVVGLFDAFVPLLGECFERCKVGLRCPHI
jgi:hypothetical protein